MDGWMDGCICDVMWMASRSPNRNMRRAQIIERIMREQSTNKIKITAMELFVGCERFPDSFICMYASFLFFFSWGESWWHQQNDDNSSTGWLICYKTCQKSFCLADCRYTFKCFFPLNPQPEWQTNKTKSYSDSVTIVWAIVLLLLFSISIEMAICWHTHTHTHSHGVDALDFRAYNILQYIV